jgi:hypothetical protein
MDVLKSKSICYKLVSVIDAEELQQEDTGPEFETEVGIQEGGKNIAGVAGCDMSELRWKSQRTFLTKKSKTFGSLLVTIADFFLQI